MPEGMGPATGLAYPDALAAVLEQVAERTPATERVGLHDALGRALAEDVSSRIALPPWDNAGMDGYAVQRADVMGASPSSVAPRATFSRPGDER
jgi:molybdopterin molybdotransferase